MTLERRIKNILVDYGTFPKQELADCTRKIERRLGNLRMKECLAALEENRMEDWVSLLLIYYDKLYSHSLNERTAVKRLQLQVSDDLAEEDVVHSIIQLANQLIS
jgi:tRNA 2-selenouridine synthase